MGGEERVGEHGEGGRDGGQDGRKWGIRKEER